MYFFINFLWRIKVYAIRNLFSFQTCINSFLAYLLISFLLKFVRILFYMMDMNNEWIDYPFEETAAGMGDENRIRSNWSSKVDYVLAVLGINLAFGNFWRLAYHSSLRGGLAFFVPYTINFFLMVLPILLIEAGLGQFSNLGAISIWKLSPLFKGIGISMIFISCIIFVNFAVLIGWALYYLNTSLRSILPWSTCNNDWNGPNCFVLDKPLASTCKELNGTILANGSCINSAAVEETSNATTNPPDGHLVWTLSSLEYFHNQVLMSPSGVFGFHTINWQLGICLIVVWLFIFIASFKGVKTSGKVVYITSTVPFLVVFALFVRLLTLPGSLDGLYHYLRPDWTVLLDYKVWGDSAIQVFYSMPVCIGLFTLFASYNRFHNNIFRDVSIFCFINVFISFSLSCVIFLAIGYFCHALDIDEEKFLLQDDLQTMIVFFSTLISKMQVPHLFSFLFFGLLLLILFNAQLFLTENIVSCICDEFPEKLRRKHRKVLAVVLIVFYALNVPLCSSIGFYWLIMTSEFLNTLPLITIAFFEVMVVAWIYGVDNLLDNIKWMIGYYLPVYLLWNIVWKFLCPFLLLATLSYAWIIDYPDDSGGRNEALLEAPGWVVKIGWAISFSPLVIIFVTALYKFFTAQGTFSKRWRDLLNPEDDWGPALAVHRAEHYPMQIPEARKLAPYYLSRSMNGTADRSDTEQFIERHSRPPPSYQYQQQSLAELYPQTYINSRLTTAKNVEKETTI